jgi:hypothetical protein
MATEGPRGSCGMELNCQIFIVSYLQFVGRKRLHAALCSTGNGAPAVARKPQRRFVHEWFRVYGRRVKGKEIPLKAWKGPEGFQEVVAPRFQDNRHMKVVRLSALGTGRLYQPGNIPGTHFC